MDLIVFLGDGVGSHDDLKAKSLFNISFEVTNSIAGRIAYDHPRCEMRYICSVLFHLSRCIFHISARTTTACGISYKLYVFIFITIKGALSVVKGSQTFSPSAGRISVTDNDAEAHDFFHSQSPFSFMYR